MNLPRQLIPIDKQLISLPSGGTAALPVCKPVFSKWNHKPPAFDFGKKPIVDHDGRPVFAELALLNLLHAAGCDGVWVQAFGGTHFLHDMPSDWKLASQHVDIPFERERLLRTIWEKAQTTACFDLFAWNHADILFCESK